MTSAFSSLQLHDATLQVIEFDWKAGRCVVTLQDRSMEGQKVEKVFLTFLEVNHLEIPREFAWGESTSINEVREEEGFFQIEIQSGDVISVAAKSFLYSREHLIF